MNSFSKKLQANLISNSSKLKPSTVATTFTPSANNLKLKSNLSNASNSSSTSNSSSEPSMEKYQTLTNTTISTTNTNSNSQTSAAAAASTSLWIGNVDPNVTEDVLIEMFSAYGPLANVRCLPDKYCAFVNFKTKEDAFKAMQNLQGKNLEGQRILIKYPDNPNTALLGTLVAKSQQQSIKTPIETKKIGETKLVNKKVGRERN